MTTPTTVKIRKYLAAYAGKISEKQLSKDMGLPMATITRVVNEGLRDGWLKVATPETKEIDLEVVYNGKE